MESALVLPLTVFLGLGLLQLAGLEQAKLMTEYAAFSAARAGAVWNGNNERMRDAALFALLPTFGRTDSPAELARTYSRVGELDRALASRGLGRPDGDLPAAFRVENALGLVRVDTLSPALYRSLGGVWNLKGGAAWSELDFDGPDTFPQIGDYERRFVEQVGRGARDSGQTLYRRANVLSLRLRTFYELRIPFADWVIFTAWFAANAGKRLFGAIDRPSLQPGNVVSARGGVDALGQAGRGVQHAQGFDSVTRSDMALLWALGMRGVRGAGRHLLLPLTATAQMRMQSNFYRKWVMHERPSWEP